MVGDPHLGIGYAMMVAHLDSLGSEDVTFFGRLEERDAVVDAEGELSMAVHDSRHRQVGQGEEGSTLAHIASVEVVLFHCHDRFGIALAHLGELCARGGGEAVFFVEEIKKGHCLNVEF